MTLLVSGMMAVAHVYLVWRLTKATGFITRRSILLWLPLLLFISFYALPLTGSILYAGSGEVDVLKIFKLFTYWFWFGFAFTFQLPICIITLDVLKVTAHSGTNWSSSGINTYYGWTAISLTILIFVYSALKMYDNTTRVRTEKVRVALQSLPAGTDTLRIIHISDVQGDEYTGAGEIANYVDKINELEPDLVIFTGDLISYGTDYIEMSARELGKVKATYGAYAVVGDHDYWAGVSAVEPALEKNGIRLLRDENTFIPIAQDSLLLTGITEVYSKPANSGDVGRLTARSSPAFLKILASHQISELLISQSQENGYNVLLAGHTHGGQIRLSFFGMNFSAPDFETPYVSGRYQEGDLLININNGLGFTLAPVRYNAPPAITVIEVVKEK